MSLHTLGLLATGVWFALAGQRALTAMPADVVAWQLRVFLILWALGPTALAAITARRMRPRSPLVVAGWWAGVATVEWAGFDRLDSPPAAVLQFLGGNVGAWRSLNAYFVVPLAQAFGYLVVGLVAEHCPVWRSFAPVDAAHESDREP